MMHVCYSTAPDGRVWILAGVKLINLREGCTDYVILMWCQLSP